MAKILLVEDEINIASFIERGLREFGHTVTVAHDGTSGWELLQNEAFDLLILDIIMPGTNGLDLCRQYRQREGYQTPVVMLTALGTTEDIVKGLDAGADDYLVKPFSFRSWKPVSKHCSAGAKKARHCNSPATILYWTVIPVVPSGESSPLTSP